MAINIKKAPAAPEQSPHEQAAADITTETSKTLTKGGEVLNQDHTSLSEQGPHYPPQVALERIEVGTSFKMPVADYTMLEFSVKRSIPFPTGEGMVEVIFEECKTWVEAKLNQMIEEQQAGG